MRKVLLLILFVVPYLFAGAQTKKITGKITDANGKPLAHATVAVKGANISTETNENGEYTIVVSPKNKSITFSSVGFETQEIQIAGKSIIDASLPISNMQIDEVVIKVPYGSIKKTAFVGSEATISSKSISKQQVTSVTKAVEGLIAGVATSGSSGAPGSRASIVIRGIGTMTSSATPLYVVNGAPYDGDIESLSIEDIETVTVLKDASSTALYGSRAANGVILITTKKGKKGKSNIQFNFNQGYNTRAIPNYDKVNQSQYYELMWEATRNSLVSSGQTYATAGATASAQLTNGNHLVYNSYDLPGGQLVNALTGKFNPNAKQLWNDSWENAFFRTGTRQNMNLNISGASDKTDYMFSFGYLDEQGIAKNSSLKRFTTRLDVNTQANDWLKVGMNIDGAFNNNDYLTSGGTGASNLFFFNQTMAPIYPVYQRDATGAFVVDPATNAPAYDYGTPAQMGTRPYLGNSNPAGTIPLDIQNAKYLNANVNTYAEITFLKNFMFKTNIAANYYNEEDLSYANALHGDAQGVGGRATRNNAVTSSVTFNQVLSWNKDFLKEHHITALAGHESYKYVNNGLGAEKTGFPFAGLTEVSAGTITTNASSQEDVQTIESYFSNINYAFKSRYLLSASIRRDGISNFHPDYRWNNFYSFGAGWRLSQEKFMENVKWINELKYKVSYGEVGNSSIGTYYAYQSVYNSGISNNNFPGTSVSSPPNPLLTWESNNVFNTGFDFSFFKNRLQGSVDYYIKSSNQLVLNVPLTQSAGIGSLNENVGKMQNSGIEIALGYNAVVKKDFDWRVDFNITFNKNEIKYIPTTIPNQEIVVGTKKWAVGHSIEDFWLKDFAGVDAATGDALYYKDILDASGKATAKTVTNKFSQASYYYHGSSLPDYYGGISNSFRYKNFDLSILISYSHGGLFYDGNYSSIMHYGDYGVAWHTDILNRWQKPGDITNVPRIENAVADQAGTSTRFLFDASYIKIKNIQLAYQLPKKVLKKAGIASVKIFTSLDNVALFAAKRGMDPQQSFSGTSDYSYSPNRTFTFGASINL